MNIAELESLEKYCLTELHDWKNKWTNTFEIRYLSYIMIAEGIKFILANVEQKSRLIFIKEAIRNGYFYHFEENIKNDCTPENSDPGSCD